MPRCVDIGLATEVVLGPMDDCDELFNSAIMHQEVSTRLFVAKVAVSAEVNALAKEFNLSQQFVRRHWTMTGTVTPPHSVPRLRGFASRKRLEYSRPVDFSDLLRRLPAETPSDFLTTDCTFRVTHKDIVLSGNGSVAERKGRWGAYRCAQGLKEMSKGLGTTSYQEIEYLSQEKSGHMCVGLADADHKMNSIVGSDGWSLGLYSTGETIFRNCYTKTCEPFKVGDIIGVSTRVVHVADSPVTEKSSPDSSAKLAQIHCEELSREESKASLAEVCFYVNGKRVGSTAHFVPIRLNSTLYPTVSLFREGTRVRLRRGQKDTVSSGTSSTIGTV